MAFLVDTNILLRYVQPRDPSYAVARAAVSHLRQRGEVLCIAPQNIMEFWSVATRPASQRGGFGLTSKQTGARVKLLERAFALLPYPPEVYAEWRRLVNSASTTGAQVHDAHLAAVMRLSDITHIITFNVADFSSYLGITAVHPNTV